MGSEMCIRDSTEDRDSLPAIIDQLLPQTQCAQCGYGGCRPYAEAIAEGAPINLCPPGGEALIKQLSHQLNRPELPLSAEVPATVPKQIARIDESQCIGCTLCIPACPVDAIVGAQQFTHTIIESECTGCKLCLPPCPCLLYTSPSPRDLSTSRMPSSA